jgi:hypothetical protein
MATIIQKLPIKIIQAIEKEKLSTNHVIYYDIEHGWVCQQRDDTLINSITKSIEQKTSTELVNEARPLEKLGPFGRFDIF